MINVTYKIADQTSPKYHRGYLVDENNNPISGATITVKITGSTVNDTKTVTTASNGYFDATWNNVTEYIVTSRADYAGDDSHHSCFDKRGW